MYKWFAILLAGVITFQSLRISPGDVFNMGELMEHARYHKELYGDTLLTFISKHYGFVQGAAMDHSDEEHHKSLPFQHTSSPSFGPMTIVYPTEFHLSLPEVTTPAKDTFYNTFYTTLFVNKTFQPPKRG